MKSGFSGRVSRLLTRAVCRRRLSILIYHRVLAAPDPMRPGDVDEEAFRWQMRLVAKGFDVMPLAEAVERLRRDTLPPRPLCVTFDDGYADNATRALPILRECGSSATFFVATGYLDGGRMWNDTVIDAVARIDRSDLDLVARGLGRHSLADTGARRRTAQTLLAALKYLPGQERQAHADHLAGMVEGGLPGDLMMNSAQLRSLVEGGMDVGGHTDTHPILARTDAATAEREIALGKARLEQVLGRPVSLFAYPNGKPGSDFGDEHVAMARAAGFAAAVTTAPGVADARSDRWRLPRFTPWDRTPARFLVRLLANARKLH